VVHWPRGEVLVTRVLLKAFESNKVLLKLLTARSLSTNK
jgi:hypothetical protein